MSGQVDVGWAAPPFGLDQLDRNEIRQIATGNDTVFKGQTVRLLITNTQTLQNRKDAIDRYMRAYRETIDWMYSLIRRRSRPMPSSPASVKPRRNASATTISRKLRFRPDEIIGLDHDHARGGQPEVHPGSADQGTARRADPHSAAELAGNALRSPDELMSGAEARGCATLHAATIQRYVRFHRSIRSRLAVMRAMTRRNCASSSRVTPASDCIGDAARQRQQLVAHALGLGRQPYLRPALVVGAAHAADRGRLSPCCGAR